MMVVLRIVLALLGLLIAALVLALAVGPREAVDREIDFDPARLPEEPAKLDAWLATRESVVPDLRADAAKRIHWDGAAGEKTPLAVVYVHGFSASAEEIRPVPDRVAEALGANLFFTRLAGHGRDGAAMAEPDAGAWVEDMAEAMAVGRRIGERVLVIGTSTGGTLAALAAHDPALSDDLAGVAFVSPNFRINQPTAPLLSLPWARVWLPRVVGEERSFTTINEGHADHWTSRYPSVALLPMAALVRHVRALDLGAVETPALFLYSDHDKVISPEAVRMAYEEWGGPKEIHALVMAPGDDPYSHVIAGDILSPSQTDHVSDLIRAWAAELRP